jgi:PAS domain S-box-containing protein
MHESDEHMEELRKTRDYLDAIVSVSYDGIVVFNEQQQFEYVNDAACRFLGMAREQLIGKHYETVVPPELRKFYQQKWDEMMAVGVEPYEGEIVGHDGSRLSVFISKKVITVGGQKKCVTIVKDISELKATGRADCGAFKDGGGAGPCDRGVAGERGEVQGAGGELRFYSCHLWL